VKALVVGGTGPTGPLIVEGLHKRGYAVTILHTGKHEVEFQFPVKHLHGPIHFLDALSGILERETFDLVVGMYGRLRYVAQAITGKTPRFIAAGGMPYETFVSGNDDGAPVPVPVREDAPLFRDKKKNNFTYLMTVSEETVMKAHSEGKYTATILRFPMIYGPRQVAPREWCVLRRILDGRSRLIVPDGGLKLERRGYIENVAHAVFLTVDKPSESSGRIYNVGDDALFSLRDWIELIAAHFDYRLEMINMPFEIARPSRPYAGRYFHWVPDIERIKDELGYTDQVSPEEGLKRTLAWYMENRPGKGGELEIALGDAFDYDLEDRLITRYERLVAELRQDFPSTYRFQHAYDHPKEREESTKPDLARHGKREARKKT